MTPHLTSRLRTALATTGFTLALAAGAGPAAATDAPAGGASPAPAAAAAPAPARLQAERVGWTALRLRATKLFLSAEAGIELRTVPATEVALRRPPGVTPVAPGPEVLVLTSEASGGGRRTRAELYMDPASGAALQRDIHDYQGRLRLRTYRYAREGAWHWTRWPRDNSERDLAPARWTRTSEGLRAYPPPAAVPGPVLEPTGLLYAVGAAALDQPGDSAEFTIFSRRTLQQVQVRVVPGPDLRVTYDELRPDSSLRRATTLRPIHLVLEGESSGGDPDEEELEVLGLRGRLELALDPDTRAPLQLTGNVKLLGRVTLRLSALTPR